MVEAVTLPMLSVGGEAPPPLPAPPPPPLGSGGDGGGGALPGTGSFGDPIRGFGQINRQMEDTQRVFSAMSTVSNGINAGLEAGNAARTAEQRSQLAAGFEASQARREAMFAAPTVTGPMLPPDFAETARVPGQPVFDLAGPVPPPGIPAPASSPEAAAASPAATPSGAVAPAGPPPGTGLAAAGLAAAADGVTWGASAGKAAETAARAAAEAGRAVGGALLRGGSLAGAYFGLGTGSIPGQVAETAMQLHGTAFDPTPVAEQPARWLQPDLPAGFAAPPKIAPPPLTRSAPEPDLAAQPLPGQTPAPPEPGPEGLTPIAPGDVGPLPGFVAAPPLGVTVPGLAPAGQTPPLPGFGAAEPGLVSGQSFESRVTGPFTSRDPLVGDLANTLEAALPGLVAGVNVDALRSDGTKLTDYDIKLTDGTIIQVKSGGGKGLTSQMDATAAATGQRVIAYGPDLGGTLERSLKQRGYEVYRDPQSLINALRK